MPCGNLNNNICFVHNVQDTPRITKQYSDGFLHNEILKPKSNSENYKLMETIKTVVAHI